MMAKINFGKMMVEYARLYSNGVDESKWDSQTSVEELIISLDSKASFTLMPAFNTRSFVI